MQKCNDHYYFYTNNIMQKLKLQVTKTVSNKIGQTGKNLEKVGIEQNLDGCSSSSVETVNKVIEVKNFISISLMSFQLNCFAGNTTESCRY